MNIHLPFLSLIEGYVFSMVGTRAFAAPKRLRPRRRVERVPTTINGYPPLEERAPKERAIRRAEATSAAQASKRDARSWSVRNYEGNAKLPTNHPHPQRTCSLLLLLAWLGSGWTLQADSSCDVSVRLDAVMVSSNTSVVGFPPLLPEHANPAVFFTKKLETEVSINNSCYICHERGRRVTSDYWEYDPVTGDGPFNTVWAGSVVYSSDTNGTAVFSCESTRTSPTEWSDVSCGFSLTGPGQIVVSNRTPFSYTLVVAQEEHGLAVSPRGTARKDVSELSRMTVDLYDPYALSDFLAEVAEAVQAAPWPAWTNAMRTGWAERGGRNVLNVINDERAELNAAFTKLKYRIAVRGPKDQRGSIAWLERFTPNGGGPALDTPFTEELTFTGREQFLSATGAEQGRMVDPPAQAGRIEVLLLAHWSCDTETCAPGRGKVSTGSIDVQISLGKTTAGESAGLLTLHEEQPGPDLASPRRLEYFVNHDVEVIRDGFELRQIKAPQTLALLVPLAAGYEIRFHSATAGKNLNGLYLAAGQPDFVWRIEAPERDPGRLRVTQSGAGDPLVSEFQWSDPDHAWALVVGNTRKEIRAIAENNGVRTETFTIRTPDDQPVHREVRTWRQYGGVLGDLLISEQIGGEDNPMVSTWTYYDDPREPRRFGRLQSWTQPGGARDLYDYDDAGRVRIVAATFGSTPEGRVTEYRYTPVDPLDDGSRATNIARTTIDHALGKEVRRSYRSVRADGTLEIQCHHPGAAFDDPQNLVTLVRTYADAGSNGTVEATEYPDGTLRLSRQSSDLPGRPRTVTVSVGQPNPDRSGVIAGTRTETSLDVAGRVSSRQIVDIDSGSLLAREAFSYADPFSPPEQVTYLDGASVYTARDCCRTISVLDAEDVVTEYTYDQLGRLETLTRNGVTELYSYDAADHVVLTRRQGTNGSLMTIQEAAFDLAGRQSRSSDGAGNNTLTRTEYPAGGGTVQTTVLPDGGVRREALAADGSVLEISGSATRPVRYAYGVESVDGVPQLFTLETKLTREGAETEEWTKTYTDFLGRPARIARSAGGTNEFFYNAAGQLRKARGVDGRATLYAYNSRGELEYTALDVNGSDGIDLDGDDRVTRAVRDFVGGKRRTRIYVWAAAGLDAPSLALTRESTLDGRSSSEVRFGLETSSSVEQLGGGLRRAIDRAADGSATVQEYQHGVLRSVTRTGASGESLGRTDYRYDPHGRVQAAVDASGGQERYEYDAADRTVAVVRLDSAGLTARATAIQYDAVGRATRIVYPDGAARTNDYTPTGSLRRTGGARVYPAEYEYDSQDRLLRLSTRSSAAAADTRWSYDTAGGWLAAKNYSDGVGPTFQRSAGAALQRETSARGVVSSYSYSSAGDIAAVTRSIPDEDIQFLDYDRRGRPGQVRNGTNTAWLAYHASGRVVAETLRGLTVTNILDAAQRPVRVVLQDAATAVPIAQQTVSYDGGSRIRTVEAGPITVGYSYADNSTRLLEATYRSKGVLRMVESRAYDGLHQLQRTAVAPGNAPAFIFDYQYDNAGLRTNLTESGGDRWAFGYDLAGQLTSARRYWSDGAAVAGQQFEYAWDPAGNRRLTRRGGDAAGGGLRAAAYAMTALNQYALRDVPAVVDVTGVAPFQALVSINGRLAARQSNYFHLALPVEATSAPADQAIAVQALLMNSRRTTSGHVFLPKSPEAFEHDGDGNLSSDGRWLFGWDAQNRLVSLEPQPDVPATARQQIGFSYDHRGRRAAKEVWTWNAESGGYQLTTQRRFVYDERRLLAELDGQGELLRSYVWGADVSGSRDGAAGVGGLVAMIDHESGKSYFYGYDGSGNVRALIEADDGTVAARYEYGPFGEVLRATGPLAWKNPFRFSTRYQDDETGLLYFGDRYYAADTGRWLSRDPIGESGGINLYAYAANNPINAIDPVGQDVVYLLDPKAVSVLGHPAGHAAVLIGNDSTGWHYFSFGPGKCTLNPYGGNRADNLTYRGFRTFADARKDPGLARYLNYARWETDSAADRKAIEAVRKFFDKRFNICTRTCSDLAAAALLAAGVDFEERWRPVDAYNANKSDADDAGKFPKPTTPAAR